MLNRVYEYLIQKHWFRDLTGEDFFLDYDNVWHPIDKFRKGFRLKRTHKMKNGFECSCPNCANGLAGSNSFKEEVSDSVWKAECINCNKVSYWNPDIIPGVLQCDINGNPL